MFLEVSPLTKNKKGVITVHPKELVNTNHITNIYPVGEYTLLVIKRGAHLKGIYYYAIAESYEGIKSQLRKCGEIGQWDNYHS